jgi:hypothetical protein
MAAATVNPNPPTTQPQLTAEGVCARCPNSVTNNSVYCPGCTRLVRLEVEYEHSLERRADCYGGEL